MIINRDSYRLMWRCNVLATCFGFALLVSMAPAAAQSNKTDRGTVVGAEWQSLYSTHSNFFNGVSAWYGVDLKPRWRAGIHFEYSFAPYHGDNGWKLYQLRFWPVCLNISYAAVRTKNTALYAELEPGLSWVRYTKQEADPDIKPYVKHERGLYLYAGARLEENITRDVQATFGAGIKSFHLSFNALEVNPHGITVSAGLQYHFPEPVK